MQQAYEDFDRRALLIKGWSVTLSLGGIAIAFQEESIQILILSGLVALLFWVLEAMWKFFQYCNSVRIQEIESYFRGEIDSLTPLQAYSTWFEAFQNSKSWSREIAANMMLGPVVIPHAPAVIVVIGLTILHSLSNGVF